MKYGLSYQGSKNTIAEDICDLFPVRTNFYDLFAGGGAITHRMLLLGMFENYTMSDINPLPLSLFRDCVEKNVPDPRWVSREEFMATKDTDAYSACCFSFGGDWATYLYAKEKEATQRALHQALVYDDLSELDMDIDLSFMRDYDTWNERRLAVNRVIPKENRSVELERMVQLVDISKLRASSLTILNAKYDDVEIKPDSVIYCDPPYKDTKGYVAGGFNHDAFYDWCRKQTELTFISEYTMPDDFDVVATFSRTEHKSATSNIKKITERLFIPSHQRQLYDESKTTLF